MRALTVSGWNLTVGDDDEPRVRDLELAERLGFSRPRDVRKLIKDLTVAGKLHDVAHRDGAARAPGQVAARPEREFWLTEAQALKVIAKSETDVADAILDEVIRVFIAVRRGELTSATTTARAEGQRDAMRALLGDGELRDNTTLAEQVKAMIGRVAEAENTTWHKAHGALRREFSIVSYLRIRLSIFDLVSRWLMARIVRPRLPRPEPAMPLFDKLLTR